MSKAKAREFRNSPTDAERVLWQHIRMRQVGGYKFRRQQPLGPYIVDFACLENRLVIEVDGGQHSEQITYDAERSAWLETQGFVMLRFWDHEVLKEIDAVKEVIWRALLLGSGGIPPTLVLPRKGGGNMGKVQL